MNLQVDGKKTLVTGSTAGIGFAIARTLAREGASVVITGRTQQRVDNATETIRKEIRDAKISGIAVDLATPEGISKCIEAVPAVDVLVNNVGVYEPKPFEQITDDDWHTIIEVNFMSGVRLSRHYLSRMKAANWGRIIFISSESAINIPVEMIHYGVTKTMQVALARGLAETTLGTALTVNSVLAGPTRSEGVEKFLIDMARTKNVTPEEIEKEFFHTARPGSLLQRFATTDEVERRAVHRQPSFVGDQRRGAPCRRRRCALDFLTTAHKHFSHLLDRRVQFRLTTPGDKDIGTLIYKPFRRGKADTAVATGDKRNLSIELAELFPVSCHFPVWVGFD